MSARIESLETVFSGWNRVLLARVRTAGGAVVSRVIEDHGDAAAVLAYDPERRCALLVRQMRPPVLHAGGLQSLIETIAGGVESGEPPADAVLREAMEEGGLRLGELVCVANAYTGPGFSTERMALYLAEYRAGDRIGPGGGIEGEHEEIEVLEVALCEVAAWLRQGRIDDLKTLALIQALMLRRPDLFDG